MSEEINGLSQTFPENTIRIEEEEEVKVKYEKKSEVDRDKQTSLNGDTIFKFSSEVKDDVLVLTLSEIGALCPFIYRGKFSKDDLEQQHPVFKSCDNLEEIEKHIDVLFKKGKISILQNDEDGIALTIIIYFMAGEATFRLDLEKKMTTDKDDVLIELYDRQKKGKKIFKELEEQLEKSGLKEALEQIKIIKQKYNN